MITLETVFLRALEPEDINVLFSIENDSSLQSFSTHNGPYSRFLLQRYLEQQNQSIYEQQQQRLVISDQSKNALGLVDLFEFEPKSKRAGVGLVVLAPYRKMGVAKKALTLLEKYVIDNYDLHMLHADVLSSNLASCRLFESCKFVEMGIKREWYYIDSTYQDAKFYQKLLKR